MQAIFIGIASGLLTIFSVQLLKKFDKATVYAMILVGIGYLYVGFTWSDTGSLVICAAQALVFMAIAYYGLWDMYILAAGFFLHGIWDMIVGLFPLSKLIPPHYDLFCMSIDFVMGAYLVILAYRKSRTVNLNLVV
ncbi:MAG: DUF6010 family protein [Sediminibacterium sp.]